MKTIAKWAAIFALPYLIAHYTVYSTELQHVEKLPLILFGCVYLFMAPPIFFVLRENKRTATVPINFGRMLITGVITAITFALITGFFMGFYFNVINKSVKETTTKDLFEHAVVRFRDSTATTTEEYYSHLMQDKDTGFLTPEAYRVYELAAQDSVAAVKLQAKALADENLGIFGNMKRIMFLAPIMGLMFSIVISLYLNRNDAQPV